MDDMNESDDEEDDDTEISDNEDTSSDNDADRDETSWDRSSKCTPSLSISQFSEPLRTPSTSLWLATPQLPSLPSLFGTRTSSMGHSSGSISSRRSRKSSTRALQRSLGFSRPQVTPVERPRADRVARNILKRPGGTTRKRLFGKR